MVVKFDTCPTCGKWMFTELWQAMLGAVLVATRVGRPASAYWSDECHAYHVTQGRGSRRFRAAPLEPGEK